MADKLQDTLSRLQSKIEAISYRYSALETEKNRVDNLNKEFQEKIENLKKEIQNLEMENEYLKLARQIAPTQTELDNSRSIIAKLVRDVDKCIAQLNE